MTDARHIECRREPGNAVLDLSVSVRAHILDPDEKLESRKLFPHQWEPTTSPCTLIHWRVQIPSASFVKEVGQSFSRSEGEAELLDETGVSLRGWIVTVDG